MTADDLSAPLGQDKRPPQHRRGLSLLQIVAAALGASAITFVGWVILVEDPLGGEPAAIAHVDLAAVSKGKPEQAEPVARQKGIGPHERTDSSSEEQPARPPPAGRTITIIDGMSGQRREIVIPAPADSGSNEQSAPARPARGAGPKATPDARPTAGTISVR